jgi:hypothetical protein
VPVGQPDYQQQLDEQVVGTENDANTSNEPVGKAAKLKPLQRKEGGEVEVTVCRWRGARGERRAGGGGTLLLLLRGRRRRWGRSMVLVEGASGVMRRIAIASALLHMGFQEQMFGH